MGKCYRSTIIHASIEDVWLLLRDFHDLSWAGDVITHLEKEGSQSGTRPGAKRILNQVFNETLISIDHEKYVLSYSIDDGPGPLDSSQVESYIGTIDLAPVTDQDATFVEWKSMFRSNNDDEILSFCSPIYSALLEALKRHFNEKNQEPTLDSVVSA